MTSDATTHDPPRGPRAEIRIRSVTPNPDRVGHDERWIIDCDVLRGQVGESPADSWPEDLRRLRLLVHSPSKTFAEPVDELPRQTFHIELEAPVAEVYRGPIRILDGDAP